jgi:DNA-directed RNA polymerase specialized sigma24 family protein
MTSETRVHHTYQMWKQKTTDTVYTRPVFSHALRILNDVSHAETVTQDVFADRWAHAATFVPPDGPDATWRLSMTQQRAIPMRRQQQGQTGSGPHIEPEHLKLTRSLRVCKRLFILLFAER